MEIRTKVLQNAIGTLQLQLEEFTNTATHARTSIQAISKRDSRLRDMPAYASPDKIDELNILIDTAIAQHALTKSLIALAVTLVDQNQPAFDTRSAQHIWQRGLNTLIEDQNLDDETRRLLVKIPADGDFLHILTNCIEDNNELLADYRTVLKIYIRVLELEPPRTLN